MERFFLGKDLSMQNGTFDLSAYLLINQINDDADDPYLELHAFITKTVDIDKNFNFDNLLSQRDKPIQHFSKNDLVLGEMNQLTKEQIKQF